MRICAVIGSGGFGREVLPLARHWMQRWETPELPEARTDTELVFVVDDTYHKGDERINGHRVLSISKFLATPASERRYTIAIGDSRTRERIAGSIPRDLALPFDIYAPTHVSLDGNSIGEGAIFCNFTHVTSNAKIGRFFHCNIYSYVAHDCVIGDFVTFAPGVKCNGHVVVEDHAYIGTGAIIRDGTSTPIVIGKGAVVGMGAVVTKSVPPYTTVVGNPARPVGAGS
jgi:sugar O-acyltransferase (sialic acid O-acetyltransferase NeuD family)